MPRYPTVIELAAPIDVNGYMAVASWVFAESWLSNPDEDSREAVAVFDEREWQRFNEGRERETRPGQAA